MNKYLVLILIMAFTSCNQNSKKEGFVKENNPEIQQITDSAATRLINEPLINSTSIGIYYKDQEYTGHYGQLEKGKNKPPSNNTIYEIGSLSKVLTGTLLAKAVLEGKIDLEDNVTKYLKGEYPNLAYKDHPIKIKHLLTHSSGLPNILPASLNPYLTTEFLKHDTPAKIDSILNEYDQESFLEDLHTITIDTIPGVNYAYSSAATELTAHILEKVYPSEYEKLLTDFLSKEVGMTQTEITLDQNEKKNLAVGYHADHPDSTLPMGKLPWGAGGNIKSTVPDMIKFIKYQLGNSAIAEESRKVIIDYSEEIGVAYFWQVDSSNNELGKHYLHHGGVPGAQCYIYIVPKLEMGIFLITNQSGKDTAPKMKKAIDEILAGIVKVNDQKPVLTKNLSH